MSIAAKMKRAKNRAQNRKYRAKYNQGVMMDILKSVPVYSDKALEILINMIGNEEMTRYVKELIKSGEEYRNKYFDAMEEIDTLRHQLDFMPTSLICWHEYGAEHEPEVTVYPYLEDRAFGGHEEGGWYYTTTSVITPERRSKVCRWRHLNDLDDSRYSPRQWSERWTITDCSSAH